jgi:hypothetical protein
MIRKTIYALAATAALAVAALPSAASAKPWHHHHGHRGWGGFGLTIVTSDYDDCGWQYYRVGRRIYKQWVCG